MILTTTSALDNRPVQEYLGIVASEAIIGANVFKDFFAAVRDIMGGRSASYEQVLREAKQTAMQELEARARELGADAVIGIDLDYETIGQGSSMLMVVASGTAVKLSEGA